MFRADFHTHTCYDHGRHTPSQMAAEAARLGMTALGLVGHARMTLPCDYAMTADGERRFVAEAAALKAQYAGKLDIFCGIELDFYSQPVDQPYDYRIGSVHYLRCADRIVSVDSCAEDLLGLARQHFHGSFRPLVRLYYQTMAQIVAATDCDIIGHFDLITKFLERRPLFDPDDPTCRRAALESLEALLPYERLFEINTGAISRGFRTAPYPAPFLLQYIRQHGGRILLSSDAHEASALLHRFGESAELARVCGFRTVWMLTPNGFQEIPL